MSQAAIWQWTAQHMRLFVLVYHSLARCILRFLLADKADTLENQAPHSPSPTPEKWRIVLYWVDKYRECNRAVANQRLSGSNNVWRTKVGYHHSSVVETAKYRFSILQGEHLSLRNYDVQVGETMGAELDDSSRNAPQYLY